MSNACDCCQKQLNTIFFEMDDDSPISGKVFELSLPGDFPKFKKVHYEDGGIPFNQLNKKHFVSIIEKSVAQKKMVICPHCENETTINTINYVPEDGHKVVKLYVNGEPESYFEQADRLGFEDNSDAERMFTGWAYEITCHVDVNLRTGETKIIGVDGKKVSEEDV